MFFTIVGQRMLRGVMCGISSDFVVMSQNSRRGMMRDLVVHRRLGLRSDDE